MAEKEVAPMKRNRRSRETLPELCRYTKRTKTKAYHYARVWIDGQWHNCGAWDVENDRATPQARAEYDRLISAWSANGRRLPTTQRAERTV